MRCLVVAAAARAAAAAVPHDALQRYFQLAETIWQPDSLAGRCLAIQRRDGWEPRIIQQLQNFKTLGVEGAGHHWLASMPRDVCNGRERGRCGGLASFSECGGCCRRKGTKLLPAARPKDRGNAWRCFDNEKPGYPSLEPLQHHVVLIRDTTSTMESILRRFWQFDVTEVDTLAREESMFADAHAFLERKIAKLDCRRTLFLSYDHVQRGWRGAHVAAMAAFLRIQRSNPGLREFFSTRRNVSSSNCVARVRPLLPRLRAYAAWLRAGHAPTDSGCAEPVEPVVEACTRDGDDACALAWRARFARCAQALRAKHTTTAALAAAGSCGNGSASLRPGPVV